MEQKIYALKCEPNQKQPAVEAVETLFAQLPAANKLSAQSKVLIKPNLLAKNTPEKAITTDPLVLRGVILALQKRGVKDITVADSPGGSYSPSIMESVYKTCGLAAVCEETGVKAYTACESGPRPTDGKVVKNFTLLNPVLESDFMISIPKLKTHVLTGMSGGVKNLFGCVPGLQKAEFHMRFPDRFLFGHMLVDLCETVKPDITIVDGLLGMEGDGPSGGAARPFGLLLGAENPHMLDLAICRYFTMDPHRVPTLLAAFERGLCPETFDDTLLIGTDEARAPLEGFVHPRSYDGPVNQFSKVPKLFRFIVPFATEIVAPRPKIVKKTCIGCGKCAEICPEQVITIADKKASIDKNRCIRCFCCHEMCPVQAIGIHRFSLFQR